MDLYRVLLDLAKERPVFWSEADFQHALAWQLHLAHPLAKIRLEYRPPNMRMYLDLVVEAGNQRAAIELKYKTRKLETTVNGETFLLNDQGAQDCGRYDVLKDIERLEQIVDGEQFHEGYVVFLTNDPHYYRGQTDGKETIDQQFRLIEGRMIAGELRWSETAGPGTTKGREEPIRLSGQYPVHWQPYSKVDAPFGEFQILIVPVKPIARADRITVVRSVSETKLEHSVEPAEDNVAGLLKSHNDSDVLRRLLAQLAKHRPVFRSQMDLRDALAQMLSIQGWQVTLNRELANHLKVDIYAKREGDAALAIEVRYRTARFTCDVGTETFELKHQAAQDISRYDYWQDVAKLEQIVASRPGTKGYAVLISNDHLYWNKPTKQGSVDADFRLFEGRVVTGTLMWSEQAGFGTMQGREHPIHLQKVYTLRWHPYSSFSHEKNGVFKALVLEIIS